MLIPHRHHDLICKWADGYRVQIFSKVDKHWHDEEYPDWDEDYEYRINPKQED